MKPYYSFAKPLGRYIAWISRERRCVCPDFVYDIPAGLECFVVEHEMSFRNRELANTVVRHQIEVLGPLPE